MPSKASLTALQDILEYALLVQGFVENLDIEQFRQDRRTCLAVVRSIEWRAMAGSGNVYRHDYSNVTPDRAWRTATGRMDELIAMAREELSREP